MRPWLGERRLERLNGLARTESGKPVCFVPPGKKDRYYEIKVYETGEVETRRDNWHDYFNALAWLAFPRTKARINAMHAGEMPKEGARRGPLRDLLTIFDEGGAIVHCDDTRLLSLLCEFRWKELFWANRTQVLQRMRVVVLGHAVLEQALEPWPGITCKTIFAPLNASSDAAACAWLERRGRTDSPRILAPLPVFGYPGWHAQSAQPGFYDDARYFRPLRAAV
ncbi:MAG TPA: DUF3025 domain-containing protein [Burkholderiales bacterium]|nr:DUF3025 domain-containing protein [Burkholderiales bacterium]